MPPNTIDLGYAAKLPPEKAIEFFAAKGYAVSWNWWEVWESAHARAFTVAKAVQADVLESIRGALDEALADGQTRRQFARDLEPRLRALGWWGRQVVVGPDGGAEKVQLGSPHRLRTIFDSNMRSTFGAARQRQQMENAASRPFWMYDARNDGRVRPSHAAMDGQVFRSDDPIWQTHYPPNGWNCRCRVRALTAAQVRGRGLQVHDSAGALNTVQQEVGVDKRTGEVITRPGTAYRFRGGDGDMHTLTPDPGWGSAPRGLPPQAAPPSTTDPSTLTGPAAREHLAGAATAARRALAERRSEFQRVHDAIQDPTTAITSAQLKERAALHEAVDAAEKNVATAGRRAILRSRPGVFEADSEPSWQNEDLKRRRASELDDWRRMVAPDLLRAIPAPRRIRETAPGTAKADYAVGYVEISNSREDGIMVHELSHLLEADRHTFSRAVAFLSRRTAGDAIEVINDRGDLGRRDKFRNPQGLAQPYPGRVYEATRQTDGEGWHRETLVGSPGQPTARGEGDRGDVDVRATEVLSMGVEWMWLDPAGFAATDPEYFDFVWDTVVRGGR